MPCEISLLVVEESLTGDIGDDWEYTIRADLLDPLAFGSGTIHVREHLLKPGSTQVPPVPDHPLVLEGGDCGSEVRLRLTLQATEVDWLVDDHGSNVTMTSVPCPGPGQERIKTELEISARVKEAPGFQGGLAVLKVKLVAVASCVEE
jgi:hypothetical protein